MSTKNGLLSSEKSSNDGYARLTFSAFWLFGATTSYLFGSTYLATMWHGVVSIVPLGAGAIAFLSSLLGGISALLLLDIAYKRWQHIARQCSHSIEQVRWAQMAENVAFYVSLSYTGTMLVSTAFRSLVTPALLIGIEWYGLISIVGISTLHLVAYRQWQAADPEIAALIAATELSALMESEQIAFKKTVSRAGLLGASQYAQTQSDQLAQSLAQQWGNVLIEGIQANTHALQPTIQATTQTDSGVTSKDFLG